MKILVTGGAGFIGSWLVEELIKENHEVTILDNLSPQIHGSKQNSHLPCIENNQVEFICSDLRNSEVLDKVLARVEVVIHLAAETGTGQSMYQISHYYEINQQATANLFELMALRHKHIKKVILASSRSIYGEGAYLLNGQMLTPSPRDVAQMRKLDFEPKGPNGEELVLIATPENAHPRPASVYAATKLANETLGQVVAEAFGLAVIALRFQNVYGERQSLKNPYTGILSIFSNNMRQNLPINIFEDGLESRDFVHVSDVVSAINKALKLQLSGFHALNVGSGIPTSVLSIAEKLKYFLNSSSIIEVSGDFRVGDIRHCYADLNEVGSKLGFNPKISIDAGLKRFAEWACTQPLFKNETNRAMDELAIHGLSNKPLK